MKAPNIRVVAARCLHRVISGKGSLTRLLAAHGQQSEYGLLQETCFGVCRHQGELAWLRDQLLQRPLKSKDGDLGALLLVGLYQLRALSLPAYAVINESVSAAGALKKPWARGLINAVLRNYQRQEAELEATLAQIDDPALHFSFPEWLRLSFETDWPLCWQSLMQHSRKRPPMTLRVNQARISRHDYVTLLSASGHSVTPGQFAASALYLDSPVPVDELPGFSAGLVSVQDEASQLVAPLLDLEPGLAVLDACAAPGGKTCHIAESEASLTRLLAVDTDSYRLVRVKENLQRLNLAAETLEADASDPGQWWNGQGFDRILLDAPCSATGVIRRHPDITLARRPEDIGVLAQNQLQLLTALWPCLQPGGLLLYTSCSILRQENENTVAAFVAAHPEAKYERITADWGVECRYGRQLLIGDEKGPDGFFFARLRKA